MRHALREGVPPFRKITCKDCKIVFFKRMSPGHGRTNHCRKCRQARRDRDALSYLLNSRGGLE